MPEIDQKDGGGVTHKSRHNKKLIFFSEVGTIYGDHYIAWNIAYVSQMESILLLMSKLIIPSIYNTINTANNKYDS